jgi:hypothetical protein
MLIFTDEQRLQAGITSLSKRCSYCSKALKEYPLIMNDDAGMVVLHAACAAALAADIIVDLYGFFHPPEPYRQLFVLDPFQTTSAHEEVPRCSPRT